MNKNLPRQRKKMSGKLLPYHWFLVIENKLIGSLKNIPCNIEHIGSTSVEGLDAKPIIDIDIILKNFKDFESAKDALKGLGYVYKGNLGLEGREMFDITNPIHPHNLYVCDPDCLAVKNHIAFRNHLRGNSIDAEKYATLKRELAKLHSHDIDGLSSS